MQTDTGPKLLRDWIERAAARDPGKPWIVCADDGRAVRYGRIARDHRADRCLPARPADRPERPRRAARQQFDRASAQLFRRHGLRRDDLHRPCRDEPQSARQHLRAAATEVVLHQDGLDLDDLLATLPAPPMRLGRWDAPASDTFFAELARTPPSEAQTDAGPDDDAVILFTSGTSAQPKGVVLNYREHLSNIDPTADGFGITADDRVYDFRSFNWASAQLLGALVPVNRGATLVMARNSRPAASSATCRDHRVTVAAGNPTTVNILLNGDGARTATPCRRCASSPRARRRSRSRNGGASKSASAFLCAGLRIERNGLDRRHPRRTAASWHGRASIRLS